MINIVQNIDCACGNAVSGASELSVGNEANGRVAVGLLSYAFIHYSNDKLNKYAKFRTRITKVLFFIQRQAGATADCAHFIRR